MPSDPQAWAAAAAANVDLRNALEYFEEPTWPNLYMAYERLQRVEPSMVERRWVSGTKIKRF